MLDRLKSLFRKRPAALAPDPSPSAPLSLDAMLAVANGRFTESQVRKLVAHNVRRFREAAGTNPAGLWAASFVDPLSWMDDTPDFYPGLAAGMGGWGVPWMLNNQGKGDVLPVYINEYGLKLIRDWSRKISQFNEFAINALSNRVSYTIGKGMQYTVLPKPLSALGNPLSAREEGGERTAESGQRLAALAQAVLDEFIDRVRWNEREQETVWRCDRDGEAIHRFFHVGGGRTSVRFVEPECLTDLTGQTHRQYGVVTTPGDVEDVQAYSIVEDPAGDWFTSDVPARDVLHVKLNTDSDCKRGLPTLFPIRKNLERADKLLRNMSVMAQVQATFAVIRKHKQFGQSSVSAYQQAQTDVSSTLPVSGRSLPMQQLFPGSIIDTSDKTDYEFPGAKVEAAGLVAVLQAELRAAAARLVMPEWMLTVDASNGNFAGQFVAEAPSSKNFERLQVWYARRFGDGGYGREEVGGGRLVGALWRVLAIAVEYGLLPPETLTRLEIQAEGPSLVVRDKAQETNRAKTLSEAGILSDATWAKWEGLDYEQEQKQGAAKKALASRDASGPPGEDKAGGETPPSAPPGSAGGTEASVFDFGESALAAVLKEEGFSGTITDKLGRKIHYQDGHRVKGHGEGPAGDTGKKKGEPAETDRKEAVEKAHAQLASDVKAMAATPEGHTALRKGRQLAAKLKAKVAEGVRSALAGIDAESGGGLTLLAGSLKGKDPTALAAGVSRLVSVVYRCVHEEMFELLLSQQTGGPAIVAKLGAKAAAKATALAESAVWKATVWAMGKIRGKTTEGILGESAATLTDADRQLLAKLAAIAGTVLKDILAAAGAEGVGVNADALAGKLTDQLSRTHPLGEDIKVVFGKCIDTDSHKVVPCPKKKPDRYGAAGAKTRAGLNAQTPKGQQEAARAHVARLVDGPQSVRKVYRTAWQHGYGADVAAEGVLAAALGLPMAASGPDGFDMPGELGGLPVLLDAKHSLSAGYADKTQPKLAKIREWKEKGGVPAYLVVSEGHGVYLHVGIDPAQSAGFGGEKHKRAVLDPKEWDGQAIDGSGGPVPFVKVSDAKGLDKLAHSSEEVSKLRSNVTAVLKRVNMKKLNEHVEKQTEKYGEQVGAKAADADLGGSVIKGMAATEKGKAALKAFLASAEGRQMVADLA